MRRWSVVAIVAGWCVTASVAHADADKCNDILALGYYRTEAFKGNTYVNTAIKARYSKLTDEESKKNVSAGLNIPYDDLVIGGTYDQKDIQGRKEQIRRSLDVENVFRDERSYLLISGDPGIVGAWERCMDAEGRGSVTAHFEVSDPSEGKSAILVVEFRGALGLNEARVTETTKAPAGVRFVGDNCLRRGTIIRNGLSCKTQVELTSPWQTVTLLIKTDRGTADARLPPRVRVQTEYRDYPFPKGQPASDLYRGGKGGDREVIIPLKGSKSVPSDLIAGGWYFDIDKSNATRNWIHFPDKGSCHSDFQKKGPFTIDYGYTWDSTDTGGSTVCQMDLALVLRREILVGVDGSSKPQARTASSQRP